MSFEPIDAETTRPTTEIQPLVPIQPDATPTPRSTSTTETDPRRPRETEYATPYTRPREEIVPGVPPSRDG